MTTSSDDLTTELPEFDATTPLPTIPAPTVGVGTDATTELPTSSPDLSSDPLAVFREAPTVQMPTDPFRSDAGTASPAGASGAQGPHAQAGSPAGSVGAGGRTGRSGFTGAGWHSRWLCRHGRTHRLRPGLHG